MNNVSLNKGCIYGTFMKNADNLPIPRIKIKNDAKSEKEYIKIKLCRNNTSNNSDIYEVIIALFENE